MAPSLGLLLAGCSLAQGFKFLSIGDWGAKGSKQLAPDMAKFDPEFILALGDNFYSKGVSSVDDPQFNKTYEDTFSQPSLQVPWYVCAGNHDYYGGSKGIKAEIDYTQRSKRWVYPDYYYKQEITTNDSSRILVLSIDTWRLNGGDAYVKYDLSTGRVALRNRSQLVYDFEQGVIDQAAYDVISQNFADESLSEPIQLRGDPDQLSWIQAQLRLSDADWKIVIGHFPVHSATIGEHGDTKKLVTDLQPILESEGVDLYFSGHDHVLQHIQLGGVNYFGSGAGAKEHSGMNTFYKGLKGHAAGKYGFMMHEGSKTSLTTTFVTAGGGQPYTYTIRKAPKGLLSSLADSFKLW